MAASFEGAWPGPSPVPRPPIGNQFTPPPPEWRSRFQRADDTGLISPEFAADLCTHLSAGTLHANLMYRIVLGQYEDDEPTQAVRQSLLDHLVAQPEQALGLFRAAHSLGAVREFRPRCRPIGSDQVHCKATLITNAGERHITRVQARGYNFAMSCASLGMAAKLTGIVLPAGKPAGATFS